MVDPLHPDPETRFTFPDEIGEGGLEKARVMLEHALPVSLMLMEGDDDRIYVVTFHEHIPLLAMKHSLTREEAITVGEQFVRFGKGE